MDLLYDRICAKIDLDALQYNITLIKNHLPRNRKLLAVLKADAYGHGALRIAGAIRGAADMIGVAGAEEALELVQTGPAPSSGRLPCGAGGTPLLVLGHTGPAFYEAAIRYGIALTAFDVKEAERLSAAAERLGKKAHVHIAVDTGMSRLGVPATEAGADAAAAIAALPGLSVDGVFSHYAGADEADKSGAFLQERRFEAFCAMLRERGLRPGLLHIANSAAAMEEDLCHYDMVRAGIILYGLYPSPETGRAWPPLRPVMSLAAHVANVFEIEEGQGVSYGHTFIAPRKMRIATVSAGYADGYRRALSNKGSVLIGGKRCKILGRVCMDQMMVDVSDVPAVSIGEEAVLFGAQCGEFLSVEEVAGLAGSFNYEFICGIARRVPRAYFSGGSCAETVSYLLP